MKAAIYVRVSTDKQEAGNQIPSLVGYAERAGWEYEIIEEQESTRKTRPKKQELLRRLRAREFDIVLVWKLDRWARSVQELTGEIKELYDKGVKFISLQDNIDLTTSNGKLQFHIICAFAEFERDLIRDRVMMGLEKPRKEGRLGRPKGSKDKKVRRKSGYHLRWAKKSPPAN